MIEREIILELSDLLTEFCYLTVKRKDDTEKMLESVKKEYEMTVRTIKQLFRKKFNEDNKNV